MIRPAQADDLGAIAQLLDRAFAPSRFESKLVADLVGNGKAIHHWLMESDGRIVAYIAYTNAYRGDQWVGYHLAPVAVESDRQGQGLGSELIAGTLEAAPIQGKPVFVLGHPAFYPRFGFANTANPVCPFDEGNVHFMALNFSPSCEPFTIGYEAEFASA